MEYFLIGIGTLYAAHYATQAKLAMQIETLRVKATQKSEAKSLSFNETIARTISDERLRDDYGYKAPMLGDEVSPESFAKEYGAKLTTKNRLGLSSPSEDSRYARITEFDSFHGFGETRDFALRNNDETLSVYRARPFIRTKAWDTEH
jgi:hypothetical protein